MTKDLALRGSLAMSRSERRALVAMQQAQNEAAVQAAYGVAKSEAIGMVAESAVRKYGNVAVAAEEVARRSPWAAQGALDLVDRTSRALGDVVDEMRRW